MTANTETLRIHPQIGKDTIIQAIGGASICFNAKKYDDHTFSAPYDGRIKGVRLNWLYGAVACCDTCGSAKWGCGNNNYFYISMIEHTTRETWYPKTNTQGESGMELLTCTRPATYGCTVQRYKLSGYDGRNSPEVDWRGPVREVLRSNRFSFQYGEGCCYDTKTNYGFSCAMAEFIYDTIYTDKPTPEPTRSPIPCMHSSMVLYLYT